MPEPTDRLTLSIDRETHARTAVGGEEGRKRRELSLSLSLCGVLGSGNLLLRLQKTENLILSGWAWGGSEIELSPMRISIALWYFKN